MDFFSYITENALILIPVLVVIGQIIKNIQLIDNKDVYKRQVLMSLSFTSGRMSMEPRPLSA